MTIAGGGVVQRPLLLNKGRETFAHLTMEICADADRVHLPCTQGFRVTPLHPSVREVLGECAVEVRPTEAHTRLKFGRKGRLRLVFTAMTIMGGELREGEIMVMRSFGYR